MNKEDKLLLVQGIIAKKKSQKTLKYLYGVLNNKDILSKEDLVRCIKKAIKKME